MSIVREHGDWPATAPKDFDREVVMRWLQRVADLIGLADWVFMLDRDEPDDEAAIAQVEVTYGRRVAAINLRGTFGGLTPEAQRQILTHELVHIHLFRMQRQWKDLINDLAPASMSNLLKELMRNAEEDASDTIAVAIAQFLPLIEWPTSETKASA